MTFIDYKKYFYHPAHNLVNGNLWGNKSEHEFGNHFANIYCKSLDNNIIAIRELPVPGYGIADFVVIRPIESNKEGNSKAKVQAFEFKLKNWRSGLMQAHRYKYFANSSILVVPASQIKSAQNSLDLFKKLDVGLWSFNNSSGVVSKKFTPRSKKVMNNKRTTYVFDRAFEACVQN